MSSVFVTYPMLTISVSGLFFGSGVKADELQLISFNIVKLHLPLRLKSSSNIFLSAGVAFINEIHARFTIFFKAENDITSIPQHTQRHLL